MKSEQKLIITQAESESILVNDGVIFLQLRSGEDNLDPKWRGESIWELEAYVPKTVSQRWLMSLAS